MAALQAHIVSITGFVDMWRALGMIALITFYDAVLVRLHLATNQVDEARQRLRTALGLADETGMHFYEAELLRLRACTAGDIDSQRADLSSAIELAREQDAYIFELRSAADNFELSGECGRQLLVDAISRFPDGSRGRNWTRPGIGRVKRPKGKVAILGGGMAGLSTAWRLSEPGWRDRFDSITVYQRGWRLAVRALPAAGRTDASKSTACTSGWAPTRTPSGCFASVTANWTERAPTRLRRSRPGTKR